MNLISQAKKNQDKLKSQPQDKPTKKFLNLNLKNQNQTPTDKDAEPTIGTKRNIHDENNNNSQPASTDTKRNRNSDEHMTFLPSDFPLFKNQETIEDTEKRLGSEGTSVDDNPDLDFVSGTQQSLRQNKGHFITVNEADEDFKVPKNSKPGEGVPDQTYGNIVFDSGIYARRLRNEENCWIEYSLDTPNKLYLRYIMCRKGGKELAKDLIEALQAMGYKFDTIYLTPVAHLDPSITDKGINELVANYGTWGFDALSEDGTQRGNTERILERLKNFVRSPNGGSKKTKRKRHNKTKRKTKLKKRKTKGRRTQRKK